MSTAFLIFAVVVILDGLGVQLAPKNLFLVVAIAIISAAADIVERMFGRGR